MTEPIDGTRFTGRSFEPIAIATRSGIDEVLHYGAGVTVSGDGSVERSVGDADLVVYPRSALKPLQVSAMVRAGLDLPDALIAVACGSHSGEHRHLDAVRSILSSFDLAVDDLGNTPARPLGDEARRAASAAGVGPSSLQQNCSGKHAAMLATCRINDWEIKTYLNPEHPLQVAIRAEIDRLSGRVGGSVTHVGIDGCGAPTHAIPLVDLARAFATLTSERSPVVDSMVAEPGFVGGVGRDVTMWMEAVPGLIAKEGASGVMAVALPSGGAAAFKIADGSDRARQAVTVELLRCLSVDVDDSLADVRDAVAVTVLGHGEDVGLLHGLRWK